jgi:hypothetical protein
MGTVDEATIKAYIERRQLCPPFSMTSAAAVH